MERNTLDYQDRAISHLKNAVTNYGYGFLNMTMRGRKTRTVLHLIDRIGIGETLIICPPAVIETWKKEIDAMKMAPECFTIASRDMLSYKTTDHKFDWLIVDEIHDFRDWSKRSKSLYKIARNCKKRVGLTGTPFNNSVLEYFYPLKILSHGKFCAFRHATNHDDWQRYWGHTLNPMSDYPVYNLRVEKTPEFYKLLKSIAFIRDPKRVEPPKLIAIAYEKTEFQKNAIKKLRAGEYIQFDAGEAPPVGELVHRNNAEAQLCSGFMYVDFEKQNSNPIDKTKITRATFFCHTNKWIALKKLFASTLGRCVLWYNYTAEKEMLEKMFPTATVFKPGKKQIYSSVLIAHPKSAGAGIDLSSYDFSIYCGISNSYVSHRQSEFRIADQEKTIKKNYVLYCKDTVEDARLVKMRARESEHLEFYKRGERDDEICMDQ